jgi:hypothetical protein
MRRIALALGLVVLAACSSSSSKAKAAASPSTTTPSPTTAAGPDTQVWLCKPGQEPNPCLDPLTTTVVAADRTKTVQNDVAAPDPKIDCFYVYPTVSTQPTVNANLHIDAAEINVALAQASRFSQTCHVYAPLYRQVTITGLNSRSAKASAIAYGDVVSAWQNYLSRYNDGRGVVLIGHSQGAFILEQLIAKVIERDPSQLQRIVSAILLGGNVTVPDGKDTGGTFAHLVPCTSASQTGCVIAFSTFDHTPPANSLFGRSRTAGQQVLCTNPAALAGGSGPLDPYFRAHAGGLFGIGATNTVDTPWVTYPDLFVGECRNVGGASWLHVTDARKPGDERPIRLVDSLGPTWGLHLYDGNIALGNLTDIVQQQADAYPAHG